MIKNINFKQPKYIIAIIAYIGLLIVGYLAIDLFGVEIKEVDDKGLQTTEYLNSDLPTANVKDEIGSKRQNMRDAFGDITDRSAISDFVENTDTTTKKKEDFESQYSEEELALLDEQQRQAEEIKRLQELNDKLTRSAEKGKQMGADDFVLPMTDEERARALAMRRNGLMEELDRDLNNVRSGGVAEMASIGNAIDSIQRLPDIQVNEDAVIALDESSKNNLVTKKSRDDSDFFNTLSENSESNNLIKAIIDEEIKAVDGSRVRLRLLDDIEIDGTTLPKGSYLFATMSGFGKQRVKGKIESVLIGDKILRINLSIYDTTDGQEGLYVPGSTFRETAQDIGSSAMQGNMNLNSGVSSGNNIAQWATQAVQNAYQRTSNAISKAIKKNRVRLKYGTQVYLINSKDEKKR